MRLQRSLPVLCLGIALFAVFEPARAKEGEQDVRIDFSRSVLPILSEKCFLCHGPDPSSRQAGLRLDLFESATSDRGGRAAIVPGKPEESLLVQRTTSHDAPMPPLGSGKTLSDAERETLAQWIKEGAKYEVHWAFVPLPESVPVPSVKSGWVRDPIDAFVLDRLRREGLSPSRDASRERWLRRVSYDVTGLPPSPKEVTSFLSDRSSDAYESVVDRLLASPRYGERMAVPWLDSARYGDSYGYQSDLIAPVWPYRDWVVRAFNANMPYDEFVTEQLAGDLLPRASRDQVLATVFNRLHRMTNEGGSIAEEWKTEYAMDRTETFGTAMLGLTVGCARCHDHKYDPIKQKDYYRLYAYFNSIDEFGMLLSSEIVPTPSLLLPTPEQEKRLDELRGAAREARSALAKVVEGATGRFMEWSRTSTVPLVAPVVSLDFEKRSGTRVLNAVTGKPSADLLQGAKIVGGRSGEGVGFIGDDGLAVRGLGGRERWDQFSWSFWMKYPGGVPGPYVLLHRTGGTDVGFCGFDLVSDNGRLTARVMRHWPGNAVAIRTAEVIKPGEWTHIGWTWDGSGSAYGLQIYVNGVPAKTEVLQDTLWKTINAYGDLGIGSGDWTFGARFRDLGFRGGVIDDVAFFDRELSGYEMKEVFAPGSPHSPNELLQLFSTSIDAECVAARARVRKSQEDLAKFENTIYEVPVMQESGVRRPAYVLARGQYDAPKGEANIVQRGTPAFLAPMPLGAPDDRLGLAQWTTSRSNPLTARVFVNRIWQMMFGTGLVRTAENFGILGEQPSHPELLDYLSVWFIDSGWDVKALVRKIALSATYRQDSAMTPSLLERDPENRLLARGPSHRLDAEMVRDTALFAAGLLDETIGGPPVNPYQPAGIWTENNTFSPPFVQSKGKDLYRRSLYTTWKRTTPAPDMLAFDAVGREVCVMRRTRTSTPMQALVMLNDVQYVEAARTLAEHVIKSGEGIEEAFLRLAGREASPEEAEILRACYEEQFAYFRAHLLEAIALVSEGDSARDETLRASEVAAMTVTVQTIMNMDAVVWKR